MPAEITVVALTPEERRLELLIEHHLEGAAPYGEAVADDCFAYGFVTGFLMMVVHVVLHRWWPGFVQFNHQHLTQFVLAYVVLIPLAGVGASIYFLLHDHRPRKRAHLADLARLMANPLLPDLRQKYRAMAQARKIMVDQGPAACALLNPGITDDRAIVRVLAAANQQ